jgi:hypothetical protein
MNYLIYRKNMNEKKLRISKSEFREVIFVNKKRMYITPEMEIDELVGDVITGSGDEIPTQKEEEQKLDDVSNDGVDENEEDTISSNGTTGGTNTSNSGDLGQGGTDTTSYPNPVDDDSYNEENIGDITIYNGGSDSDLNGGME